MPSPVRAMSDLRSQLVPCLTYGLVRPLYPDGRRPRQAGPAFASCPDLTLLLPLSRFILTDGQMVRAAWHTIGLLWPGFSGCLLLSGAVRCTDLRAFLLQGPAVYLISAHSEPTCAHSISGARASIPVPVSSGPGRNGPCIGRLLVLRRKGRRRVHDVSFLWLPVDQHQGRRDMTGSGDPIPLGRPLSHARQTCIAVRSPGTASVINSPCPFSDLHLCASKGKPGQSALDCSSDMRGSSQPPAVVRVVDQPKA